MTSSQNSLLPHSQYPLTSSASLHQYQIGMLRATRQMWYILYFYALLFIKEVWLQDLTYGSSCSSSSPHIRSLPTTYCYWLCVEDLTVINALGEFFVVAQKQFHSRDEYSSWLRHPLCGYVTVVHVISVFNCVDCVTCIYLHRYLFYLVKSKGTVKNWFLITNTRIWSVLFLCVLNGNSEWGRIG